MVARCTHACRHECIAHDLGVLPGRAVHDARILCALQGICRDPGDLALGLRALDGEVQVRTVKPGDDTIGIGQPSRRTMSSRTRSVAVAVSAQTAGRADSFAMKAPICRYEGAEVLAPLRHAMGLIDADERYACVARKIDEARIFEPFGCYIYDGRTRLLARVRSRGFALQATASS